MDVIEPYRAKDIHRGALHGWTTGVPQFNLILTGRAKKN